MSFVLHPGAFRDLEEIRAFLAQDNVVAADLMLDEVEAAISKLAAFPQMGHLRPDISSRGLRFHVVRSFLIAYVPSSTPIPVIAVIDGRRNPRILAAILRKRMKQD